jgi:hypothetical protein
MKSLGYLGIAGTLLHTGFRPGRMNEGGARREPVEWSLVGVVAEIAPKTVYDVHVLIRAASNPAARQHSSR